MTKASKSKATTSHGKDSALQEGMTKAKKSKATTTSRGKNSKLTVKMKPTKARKAKAVVDPNKPKRPPTAFFVFMEGFRQEYKENHPDNKSVAVVGKAGGERWKSLSVAEKAPFIATADEKKADYEKSMRAYNRKLAGEADEEPEKAKSDEESDKAKSDDEESDKSKSEVHGSDEDNGSGDQEGDVDVDVDDE